MKNIKKYEVECSYTSKIYKTEIKHYKTIKNIVSEIKGNDWKGIITNARYENWADKNELQDWKRDNLAVFYPHVWLSEHTSLEKNTKIQSTGIIHFDIDFELLDHGFDNNQLQSNQIISELINIESVFYAFISISGGVKFGVLTDFSCNDKEEFNQRYSSAYDIVKSFISNQLEVSIVFDDSVQSNSGCYYSYDANAYYSDDAREYPVQDSVDQKYLELVLEQEEAKLTKEMFLDRQMKHEPETIISALSCLPNYLPYHERLKINFSVMSELGFAAKSVLSSHWDDALITGNLDKQLDDQHKKHSSNSSSNPITVASLFDEAKKYGWKFPEYVSELLPSDEPTFNRKQHSVDEATQIVNGALDKFFNERKNVALLVECGFGKTTVNLRRILELILENPYLKVAIYVPTHKLSNEINELLLEFFGIMKSNAKSLREKLQRECETVAIFGKSSTCKRNEDLPDKDRETHNCIGCSFVNKCRYVKQFVKPANIRIYAHNYLFIKSSKWEPGVITDAAGNYHPREDNLGWKPDIVIIDEDISNHAIEGKSYTSSELDDIGKKLLSHLKGGGIIDDFITDNSKIISPYYDEQDNRHKTYQRILKNASESYKEKINNTHGIKPKDLSLLKELNHMVKQKKRSLKTGSDDLIVNDRIRLNTDHNGEVLDEIYLGKLKTIREEILEKPILYLDASANEEVIKKIFGVAIEIVNVGVKYQDNVEIHQVHNQSFAKVNLLKRIDLVDELTKQFPEFGDPDVCCITYKKLTERFEQQNVFEPENRLHFGNLRGVNSFKDKNTLFVIGRHQIDYNSIANKAATLFGDLRFVKTREQAMFDHFSKERKSIPKTYRMADGEHLSKRVDDFTNPKLRAISEHLNSAETYQAVHRLRLIHGNKPKRVYLLTNEVLDLTITKHIKFNFERKIDKRSEAKFDDILDMINENGYVEDKGSYISNFCDSIKSKTYSLFKKNHQNLFDTLNLCEVTGRNVKGRKKIVQLFVKDDFQFDEYRYTILNDLPLKFNPEKEISGETINI